MAPTLRLAALALALTPSLAQADSPSDDAVVETVEIVETDDSEAATWMGLRLGSVVTPYRQTGPVRPASRITSDQAHACLDPLAARYCGNLRGFDLRLEMFEAPSRSSFPHWAVFFRTGYDAGRFAFDPTNPATGFVAGDPRSLAHQAVPLFFGANLYLFEKFPIRPYGGLGFGFDVLRLHYRQHEANDRVDVSARIGFELHAGLEARITNYVSLNVEMRQLWSARRKMADLPDYSNGGLSFIGGVAFAMPTKHTTKRKRVRTVTRTHRPEPSKEPSETKSEQSAPPMPPWHVEVVQKQEVHTAAPPPAESSTAATETDPAAAPSSDAPEPFPVEAPPATPAP
jgi:hypothetical protein